MPRSEPPTTPSVADPRPGRNPGYDEDHPHRQSDLPRHRPDARGADFGKAPDPEAGGINREVGSDPDTAE